MKKTRSNVASEPLYRQVSVTLLEQIKSGVRSVGTVLPKEIDLAQELGVSRVTLRQALDILEKGGVVQRVRKVGTKIIAAAMADAYVQQMDGLEHALRLAGQTAMRIHGHATVKGEPDTGLVGVSSSTGYWLAIDGVRHMQGASTPCTWTRVYVDNKYAGITPFLAEEVDGVYTLVEKVYGLAVHSIRHCVSACALNADAAAALGLPEGAPGLQVQAWLYAPGDVLIEYVRSIHNPALISIELKSHRAPA